MLIICTPHSYPSIHWAALIPATIFLGMSFTLVFISFLSYLIEVYLMYSASALAANTILRSAVGAAFPMFVSQSVFFVFALHPRRTRLLPSKLTFVLPTVFSRLGVNWACTLIGCIALLIAPAPFIFYKFGAKIRGSSKFAPCLDIGMKERVERELAEGKKEEKSETV